MEQIIVTVEVGGGTTVEAKGVKGKGCKAMTEAIEKALGRVTGDQHKPEYHQQAAQGQQAAQK